MKRRRAVALLALVLSAGARPVAQDTNRPREFAEFRGTWILDETDLRQARTSAGQAIPMDGLGFRAARTLVIDTTPTQLSVTKDAFLPEIYRFDGSDTQTRDPRTGAALIPRYSFTLVAETLALTRKTEMSADADGRVRTEIMTDAYSLPEWNVLWIERQLSILMQPPGHLMTLAGVRNNKTTLVYRRTAGRPAP